MAARKPLAEFGNDEHNRIREKDDRVHKKEDKMEFHGRAE
jgi:hypothetical protein